jgi:rod shape determining protein RodA
MEETNKGILKSLDWITILLYLILLVWGWFSVCGSSFDFNNPDIFGWESRSGKQLVWISCSIGLAGMLLLIEKRFYIDTSYYVYIIMMFLLAITIFIAPDTKGSRSWIPIGSSVKLQPAEFAKFAVALTIGRFMDKFGFTLRHPRLLLQVTGLIMLPIILIIGERETGSALVYLTFFIVLYREGMTGSFLFTAFAMVVYFVVGIRYSADLIPNMPVSIGKFAVLLIIEIFTIGMSMAYLKDKKLIKIISIGGIGATALALLFSLYVIPFDISVIQIAVIVLTAGYLLVSAFYHRILTYLGIALFTIGSTVFYYACDYLFTNVLEAHQRMRIEVFLGMDEDLSGAGYNVNQSKIAIGSGGLTGKGFLKGTQTKLKYVPEQDTDFIFCTVGEEEGFIGSAGVLIVYLLFIWRLLALAERQPDTIGRVYGYSVLCIFLFHLFINVGMVLGLTPVIGIPLPFFSYGGSSLWGFTILLFIFLRMDAERNLKED